VCTWLARLDRYDALDCELKLASSVGDPEDGVDGEGDIGSGEFMSMDARGFSISCLSGATCAYASPTVTTCIMPISFCCYSTVTIEKKMNKDTNNPRGHFLLVHKVPAAGGGERIFSCRAEEAKTTK